MNWNEYGAFIIEETKNLLAIDSPSGMTKKAAEHVAARFEALAMRRRRPERTACSSVSAAGIGKTACCWRRTWIPLAAWSARSRRTGG